MRTLKCWECPPLPGLFLCPSLLFVTTERREKASPCHGANLQRTLTCLSLLNSKLPSAVGIIKDGNTRALMARVHVSAVPAHVDTSSGLGRPCKWSWQRCPRNHVAISDGESPSGLVRYSSCFCLLYFFLMKVNTIRSSRLIGGKIWQRETNEDVLWDSTGVSISSLYKLLGEFDL